MSCSSLQGLRPTVAFKGRPENVHVDPEFKQHLVDMGFHRGTPNKTDWWTIQNNGYLQKGLHLRTQKVAANKKPLYSFKGDIPVKNGHAYEDVKVAHLL